MTRNFFLLTESMFMSRLFIYIYIFTFLMYDVTIAISSPTNWIKCHVVMLYHNIFFFGYNHDELLNQENKLELCKVLEYRLKLRSLFVYLYIFFKENKRHLTSFFSNHFLWYDVTIFTVPPYVNTTTSCRGLSFSTTNY